MNLSRLLCVFALAPCAVACVEPRNDTEYQPPPGEVEQGSIDADATLTGVDPGTAVGAFVEATSDGSWHVWVSCDTAVTGAPCAWDIIVGPASGANTLTNPVGEGLESGDSLFWETTSDVHFISQTTDTFDGFHVDGVAGAVLRVDVYLDGQPAPRYLYWVGGGAVHAGAPSNPLDLAPTP